MAVNGADTILLVENPQGSGTYVAVGSQRDVTFNETTEPIDGSSKTDGRATRNLPGRYSASVDLDALFVPNDAAHALLKQANRLGFLVKIRRRFVGNDQEEAEAVITNMSDTHPDQDAATVAITLSVDGVWAAV